MKRLKNTKLTQNNQKHKINTQYKNKTNTKLTLTLKYKIKIKIHFYFNLNNHRSKNNEIFNNKFNH